MPDASSRTAEPRSSMLRIADLHYTIQIVMGWSDFHPNRFVIHGKEYGVSHAGGIGFSDNTDEVRLADFGFRDRECFLGPLIWMSRWLWPSRPLSVLESLRSGLPHRNQSARVLGTRVVRRAHRARQRCSSAVRRQCAIPLLAEKIHCKEDPSRAPLVNAVTSSTPEIRGLDEPRCESLSLVRNRPRGNLLP